MQDEQGTEETGSRHGTPLSVSALRRSSPLHPTRTLRLSEQEERANTPVRLSLEDLSLRPRSNPRTRTPRRYESPLDPTEFRRDSLEDDEPRIEAQRITIRPLTGRAVGTTRPQRVPEEEPRAKQKSHKQGHSHRKVRRWNNDHFVNLASEIASSSHQVAAALLKAHEQAHMHRAIYDPDDHRSEKLQRFMDDEKLRGVRDRFFEGELPVPAPTVARPRAKGPLTAEQQLNHIDTRLRSVVVKACKNSYPAAKVVETFENFVLRTFGNRDVPLADEWWSDLLMQQPTVNGSKAEFYFDADSSTGGFHRLLLHAVCQFHGLRAVSKSVNVGKTPSRALLVSGTMTASTHSLVNLVADLDADSDRAGWILVRN